MDYDPDGAVDHGGMVAPYQQLAGILVARIERGDWQPGRRMASEADLQQQYGLSRKTVRKAIGVLEGDGLVVVVPQRGTYVKPQQ
jgi:GntR family transcriptional regulator